jgi:hypothetical protein
MVTLIVLVLYIIGTWTAYEQLIDWSNGTLSEEEDYRKVFLLSSLSWLLFPLYGLLCIIRKVEGEE